MNDESANATFRYAFPPFPQPARTAGRTGKRRYSVDRFLQGDVMKRNMQGFTLIELMIVIAIIGVLAAIGLPIYQDYTVKSQAAAALAEITPGKIGFEQAINEGKTPDNDPTKEGFIGIGKASSFCSTITVDDSSIVCDTSGGNLTKFNSKKLSLKRDKDSGAWSCTTTLDAKYRPGKCTE